MSSPLERLRLHLQGEVLNLTGLALGQIDYENPRGDPGLFGPDSVCWKVHGDFTSMLAGGIAALLLQALHPLVLAGVWDHSNFRSDMLGRLRRTGQFISGTTYAAQADVDWLIDKVCRIHAQIAGQAADGRSYAASDPELLTWVHVAEVSSFLAAHLRYRNPDLSLAEQDRYYAEMAVVAERLGATQVPRSRSEIAAYFAARQAELRCDQRTREILQVLLAEPAPSLLTKPFGALMMRAGMDLLPDWARALYGMPQAPLRRRLVRGAVNSIAPLLRWAVRDAAVHRAQRRVANPRP
jgi:uncharacterized protein (DUF2236 family)